MNYDQKKRPNCGVTSVRILIHSYSVELNILVILCRHHEHSIMFALGNAKEKVLSFSYQKDDDVMAIILLLFLL
jgi:hypothetical protein